MIRSRLRSRWKIADDCWFPLSECTLHDVVAFKARAFDEAVAYERLQGVLAARGIDRVWELRESGLDYEEDLAFFEPYYNFDEGYWSSGHLDWIIYASHESSITVGGWLLEELKKMWPLWQSHLWTGILD